MIQGSVSPCAYGENPLPAPPNKAHCIGLKPDWPVHVSQQSVGARYFDTRAGEDADVAFVAKDAKGFQKCLGGDVFTVSWARAGDDEPATSGEALDSGCVTHPPSQMKAIEGHRTGRAAAPHISRGWRRMQEHMTPVRAVQALLGPVMT